MNVATIKLLCWLTSIALSGGLGWLLYGYYGDQQGSVNAFDKARAESVLADVPPAAAKTSQGLDYQQVVATMNEMNWTGKPKPKPENPGPKPPENPRPQHVPVQDLLRIMMIQEDPVDPAESFIYVHWIGTMRSGPRQEDPHGRLAVGEALPSPQQGVKVKEIRTSGVIFEFDAEGRDPETLLLGDADEVVIAKIGPDGNRYPVRRAGLEIPKGDRSLRVPEQTELWKRNHYRMGTEDVQFFQDNYANVLANDLQYRTYRDQNGRRAGIQVQNVRAGSIAERHGAQAGDIILAINGTPVSSDQEAIAFVKRNANKYSTWEVQILRLGREMTLTFESPGK